MPFAKPCFKRHLHVRRGIPDASHPFHAERSVSFHYGRERGLLLEDVDEAQMLLLSLLDGQHSFAEIVNLLQNHDPTITVEDISATLEDLAQYGLLEDVSISPPADFTPEYLERYESQLRFLSVLDETGIQKYTLQTRLKNARVAVLGLGGLGSNVLGGLAAIGVGFLRGVDFDTVEASNLNRQVLYDLADIGKRKAQAAAEQLARFNPFVTFEPVQQQIIGKQDIIGLIKDVDLVAFCADLPLDITSWMNEASLECRVPFIMGGYRGAAAEVGPFVVPYETGCCGCYPGGQRGDKGEIPELAWMNEAFWLRHPNIHFVTALAANLLCCDICKHLTGIQKPATYNHLYTLDLEHFTLSATAWPRSPECAWCS
jgi:molybdopterin/thiamine biosynthesis adenylyltransferase